MVNKMGRKKNRYRKPKSGNKRVKVMSLFSGNSVKGLGFLTGGLFLMFLCIFIHDFLTQTHYFDIKRIEISGNSRLETGEIRKQGNLDKGMNILSINLETLRKKLIAHPWIEGAEVTRILPNDIAVLITEENPLALIFFDKPYIINKKGRIFKELNKTDDIYKLDTLPVIYGLKPSDLQDFNNKSNRYLISALEIIRMGSHSELLPVNSIGKVHVDKDLGITLTLVNLLRINNIKKTKFSVLKVRMGFDDFQLKYSRLNKVLLKLATFKNSDDKNYQKIDLIDLSNTGRVIVKVSQV